MKILIRPSGFHTCKTPAFEVLVAMVDEEFQGSLDRVAATLAATLLRRLLGLPVLDQ